MRVQRTATIIPLVIYCCEIPLAAHNYHTIAVLYCVHIVGTWCKILMKSYTCTHIGYSNIGQRDAGMGCIHWAWLNSEEYGDVSAGRRGAAEPGHQRQALGAAHAGNTGVYTYACLVRMLSLWKWGYGTFNSQSDHVKVQSFGYSGNLGLKFLRHKLHSELACLRD